MRWVYGAFTAAAALAIVACTKDLPTSPVTSPAGEALSRKDVVTALQCEASVTDKTVICDQLGVPAGATAKAERPGIREELVIGGQDVYVSVKTTNVNYDAGTGNFTFDATVRNLIPQPLGTTDGTTLDPSGVRVFFASGPVVTSGSGTVSVVGDGVVSITGPNQPYYQYSQVLDQFEISPPRTWTLNMPNTVSTFSFQLYVWSQVQFPDGYIDVQVTSIRPPNQKQVTYTVRNANGTISPIQGPLNWNSSDPTRATIDNNGLITALRAGNTTITAMTQDGLRVGSLVADIRPIRRYWTGAVSTDYAVDGNWIPAIKPVDSDTAVVADTVSSGNWPLLTANENIAGVEVLDLTPGGTIPTLGLGAFNYTATGDVLVTNSASIGNTSGSLFLAGTARTVAGTLPFVRVTGTYSLIGNVTSRARAQVDLGRLTNTGFRFQATGF
jgi:hypothetical protein